ncbi:hypothetical protein QE152_g34204 [Popillia japonica]|uniref:Uncharacterized protein n=1 Tax=Popillia japonica TaxID=7064 RepID=A0AAW1ITS7_POPJA
MRALYGIVSPNSAVTQSSICVPLSSTPGKNWEARCRGKPLDVTRKLSRSVINSFNNDLLIKFLDSLQKRQVFENTNILITISLRIKCRARAITKRDELQNELGDHNHGGDTANLEIAKFMDRLGESATIKQLTPQSISNGSVGRLPQLSSIKRILRNAGNAHDAAPALLQTRLHFVIPEVYRRTLSGENFLQLDSGYLECESRMIILATLPPPQCPQEVRTLVHGRNFQDSSPIICPIRRHGLKDNLSIPLVDVLLTDKMEGCYIYRHVQVSGLKELYDNDADFAVKPRFFNPPTFIPPKPGLKELYDNDADFAVKPRFFNPPTFIPPKPVVDTFEELCDHEMFPHEA